MKSIIVLMAGFILISGCSLNVFQKYEEPELNQDFEDLRNIAKIDSLENVIHEKQIEIETLNSLVSYQDSLIEVMQLELNEADKRIAIKQGFEIPDSIVFAGVTFDLKNERNYEKLRKAYEHEVKDAHRYIPRSGRYFAYFDSVFAKHGVPEDAKYLAIAESRLSYLAKSHVGATGIWQFMTGTARDQGMKVDEFIDQRRDVFESTEAAAKYLKFNYNYLKKRDVEDWLLAFCGYNAGIGNVCKVIREQGGKSFFDLIMSVDETDKYVWKAVATKMIIEHEEEIFGKKFTRQIPINDEVKVVSLKLNGYHEIDDWAQAQGTFVSRVWELNPWIKTYKRSRSKYSPVIDVVLPPGEYAICLPKDSVPDMDKVAEVENILKQKNTGYFEFYTVKKGDNLYDISLKFHTSVNKLKSLNGLRSNIIRPGQKLRIFAKSNGTGKEYIVKKGDYIDRIASNLGVSSKHLINKNNLSKNSKGICIIHPGQKLRY